MSQNLTAFVEVDEYPWEVGETLTKKFSFQKWEGMNEIGQGESLPMSKKLKPNQYIVLSAIAMFQGVGGVCNTTQQQLSEVLPYSRESIGKALDSLIEFRYEGQPVLNRTESVGINGKMQYVYTLLPNPLFGVFGEKPLSEESSHHGDPLCRESSHHERSLCEETSHHTKPLCEETRHSKEVISKELITKEIVNQKGAESKVTRKMKNNEVIHKFCEAYKLKTLEDYKIVWSRDNKFVTKFLKQTEDLTNNDIKRLIEITVENYDKWSSNTAKYPLTILSLTTEWIQQKARDVLKKEKQESSQMVQRAVEATERNQAAVSSIMDRIRGKGGQ